MSPYSNTASATTPTPDTTPPSQPGTLSATAVSQGEVDLSWGASTDDVGVTGYKVERCQGAGCTNFAQIATPTGTTYKDTSVSAVHELQLSRPRDRRGRQPEHVLEHGNRDLTPDTTPPTQPGTLSATVVSGGEVDLSWGASTDNVGVTGYQVERCQGAGCTNFAQIATPTGTTYKDTSVSAVHELQLSRARDGRGGQPEHATRTRRARPTPTPDTTPPTQPGTLTATVGLGRRGRSVLGRVDDNVGVTGYKVERCQGAGCTNFAQIAAPAGTSYKDTSVSPSTSYSYRVRATDAAGNLEPVLQHGQRHHSRSTVRPGCGVRVR